MANVTPHVPTKDVEHLLAESEKLRAESTALRPLTRWLIRQREQLIAENHLSEKIRHALGD